MFSFKDEFKILNFAIAIGIVGFILEFIIPGHQSFSRSGSLIVCIGIWFGYKDFKNTYIDNFNSEIEALETNRRQNDIVWSDSDLENKVRGTTDEVIERKEDEKNISIERVAKIDIAILLLGTIIWGFGTLPF